MSPVDEVPVFWMSQSLSCIDVQQQCAAMTAFWFSVQNKRAKRFVLLLDIACYEIYLQQPNAGFQIKVFIDLIKLVALLSAIIQC